MKLFTHIVESIHQIGRPVSYLLFLLISILVSPLGALAATTDPCGTGSISVDLNEPLGDCAKIQSDTAIGFILQYVKVMYVYGASTVGIICVLVIALSGMQYAFDSESADAAKKRIVNALSGLAVLFLSAVFLYVINPNFFKIN